MEKTCSKCKIAKKLDDFYKSRRHKFGVASLCKKCNLEITNKGKIEKRQRLKKWFYNEVVNMECTVCGEKEICCLDFHHTRDKKYLIGDLLRGIFGEEKTRILLLDESSKCKILCSNCHRKIHAGILKV